MCLWLLICIRRLLWDSSEVKKIPLDNKSKTDLNHLSTKYAVESVNYLDYLCQATHVVYRGPCLTYRVCIIKTIFISKS